MKTAMLFINSKKSISTSPNSERIKIKIVTDYFEQVNKAKLIGITFNDKQTWVDQIHGVAGLISSLDQKIYLILRLKNHLNLNALKRVAESKERRD